MSDSTAQTEYLQGDLLGSTRLITDDSGSVVGVNTYDAYGNRTMHTGSADTAIGYTGNWTDPATELVYLRARDSSETLDAGGRVLASVAVIPVHGRRESVKRRQVITIVAIWLIIGALIASIHSHSIENSNEVKHPE